MFFYAGDKIKEQIIRIKKNIASSVISSWYINVRNYKEGTRILNWYKNIKIRDTIMLYIENKKILKNIDIRDYYIDFENTWDYLGLEDDIYIEFERYELLTKSMNRIVKWYRKIKKEEIEPEEIESEEVESEEIESKEVESEKVESEEIESKEVESEDVECKEVEPEEVESEKIESEEIESEEIESEKFEMITNNEELEEKNLIDKIISFFFN